VRAGIDRHRLEDVDMIKAALTLLAACSSGAAAHAHDLPVPGEEDGEWALVAEDAHGGRFITGIERVGRSASFLLMAVARKPAKTVFEHDAETYAVLADCSTRQYEVTDHLLMRGGRLVPPAMVRMPAPVPGVPEVPELTPAQAEAKDHEGPPAAGSAEHRALQYACGEAALPAETIADPYRWARQRFGLKTPPAKKPR
jgi:hypothetical protein